MYLESHSNLEANQDSVLILMADFLTCLFVHFRVVIKVYDYIRYPNTSYTQNEIILKSAKFAYLCVVLEGARAFIRSPEKFLLSGWVITTEFYQCPWHRTHTHIFW